MQSAVRGTGSPVHNLQLIEPLLCLFGIICVLFLQCLVAKAQEHWRQGSLYVHWLLSDVRWLATGMCFFSEHHSSFCSSWGKKSLSHTSLRWWLPFTHSEIREQCTVSEFSPYYHGTRRKSRGFFPGNVFSAIGLIKGNTGSVRGNVY